MKLFDSELKVMSVLWEMGPQHACTIAKQLNNEIGWNVNTTYTIIKKCIAKGAIQRQEPGFLCIPLINKEAVQATEIEELIEKIFGGSRQLFFTGFIKSQNLKPSELEKIEKLINEMKGGDPDGNHED